MLGSMSRRWLTTVLLPPEEETSEAPSEPPAEESLVHLRVRRESASGVKGWIAGVSASWEPLGNCTPRIDTVDCQTQTGWERWEGRRHQEGVVPTMVRGKAAAAAASETRSQPNAASQAGGGSQRCHDIYSDG